MGQKTHPEGFRIGVTKHWRSFWYSDKTNYADCFLQDVKLRRWIKENYRNTAIADVLIRRQREKIEVEIHSARPGILIGKRASELEKIKNKVKDMTGAQSVSVTVKEVKRPEICAQLVAESIASQMERRIPHRWAMKHAISTAMRLGVKGIKIQCKGRLGGAELARTEWYREGRLPLQTLRADIDYGEAKAMTKFGVNGTKVWIFHGEILKGGITR